MKKSIYISRKITNSGAIKQWMWKNGFNKCIDDMHVTIAFDSRDHDWDDLPSDYNDMLTVKEYDRREIAQFDGGATVLSFESLDLTLRWSELLNHGLHWKWEDYKPHVTLTYDPPLDVKLSNIQPYDGEIILGEEIIVEHNEGHTIEEIELSPL